MEYDELFVFICVGKFINDGVWMVYSIMFVIWGRMVVYIGEELIWEKVLNFEEKLGLVLEDYNWDLVWKMKDVVKFGMIKFV